MFGTFVENNRQNISISNGIIYHKFVTGQSEYILSQKCTKNMNRLHAV